MNFMLEKELKNKPLESLRFNRYVSLRNPKSHSLLKNNEAVESSIKLWDCYYSRPLYEDLFPNFRTLLQKYNLHTSIYPQHSRWNKGDQKDVSCVLDVEDSNVASLRIFLPQFEYSNCLVLLGSSQKVTFAVDCLETEDLEARAQRILGASEQDEKEALKFSIDVDKLEISFIG